MNNITWPENLIEEIAYRRAIIFFGSGVSATAKFSNGNSPKTWKEFLENLKTLLKTEPSFLTKMLEQENYLMALEVIRDSIDRGQYAATLKKEYNNPTLTCSEIHKNIKEIDCKIVITTNFDKIYDNICNNHGYTVCNYDNINKIMGNLKTGENLIIKAHGTIDDIDNIIFTKRQYYDAKLKHPKFYNLLKALFMTHTVLFIGYSLNDPDINLLLEDISDSASESCPHYIVVKNGLDLELIKNWKESYNVSCLEYGPEYENLEENITNLKNLVIDLREQRRLP